MCAVQAPGPAISQSWIRLQVTACWRAHNRQQPAMRSFFMAQCKELLCPCYASRWPAIPLGRLHSTACCAADCLQQPALGLT